MTVKQPVTRNQNEVVSFHALGNLVSGALKMAECARFGVSMLIVL